MDFEADTSGIDDSVSKADLLVQRHRKEKKELQGKIQALKKSICKGDKKKKREVSEEILKLEAALEAKHNAELAELTPVNETPENVIQENSKPGEPSQTKLQRKREKRAQRDLERKQHKQEEDDEPVSTLRAEEFEKIDAQLKDRQLSQYDILSDGNCMYSALSHQLQLHGIQTTSETLRLQTSEYMMLNAEKFLPFMSSVKNDGPMSETEYEEYCNDVATTQAWGGHIELQALAAVLHRCIEVIQSDGPSIFIGEEYNDEPVLIITYHRHAYSLGEHYNSIVPCKISSKIASCNGEFV